MFFLMRTQTVFVLANTDSPPSTVPLPPNDHHQLKLLFIDFFLRSATVALLVVDLLSTELSAADIDVTNTNSSGAGLLPDAVSSDGGGVVTVDFSDSTCLNVTAGATFSLGENLAFYVNQVNSVYSFNNNSSDNDLSRATIGGSLNAISTTGTACAIRNSITDVTVAGGIFRTVIVTTSTTGQSAYGIRSDAGAIGRGSSALEVTGMVSATGDNAYGFRAAEGINLLVDSGATVSGVNTGTGDTYSIYNSQIELASGCNIVSGISLSGAAYEMMLSRTGSATLIDDIINVETIAQTGVSWDIEADIIGACNYVLTGGNLTFNGSCIDTSLTIDAVCYFNGSPTLLNLYNYDTHTGTAGLTLT